MLVPRRHSRSNSCYVCNHRCNVGGFVYANSWNFPSYCARLYSNNYCPLCGQRYKTSTLLPGYQKRGIIYIKTAVELSIHFAIHRTLIIIIRRYSILTELEFSLSHKFSTQLVSPRCLISATQLQHGAMYTQLIHVIIVSLQTAVTALACSRFPTTPPPLRRVPAHRRATGVVQHY
jgi:hypothetical protein